MSFKKLKIRIKQNEGFSIKPYKDQLGFFTIGYGHLIKNSEKKYFNNFYSKNHFEEVFEDDFNIAYNEYIKKFYVKQHKNNEKELLIEMIFQLGSTGVSKFNKMLYYLNNNQKYMACLEMIDSLWYRQTPKRVENLMSNFLSK